MGYCMYRGGHRLYFSNIIIFLSFKIVFFIASSVDLSIWIFTVCQSTHLGVLIYNIQKGLIVDVTLMPVYKHFVFTFPL